MTVQPRRSVPKLLGTQFIARASVVAVIANGKFLDDQKGYRKKLIIDRQIYRILEHRRGQTLMRFHPLFWSSFFVWEPN